MKAASEVRAAARARGKSPGNLCFVYGEKPRTNWTVVSDLEFANFLDLESDQTVKTYDLNTDRVIAQLGTEGYQGSKPDSLVTYFSGMKEIREVKYQKDIDLDLRALHQAEVQREVARESGYQWRHFTEQDAIAHACRLMNWLRISSALREAKDERTEVLEKTICQWLTDCPKATFSDLNASMACEWRLGFVAVFRLYQRQRLDVDLTREHLGWLSRISLRGEI